MHIGNLAKTTTFLSSREFAVANRTVRQEVLGDHTPALAVIDTDLFDERKRLEIEAVAAV